MGNIHLPSLAFWRELHHPAEKRRWRCRPTPLGVEIQYRDDEEAEWDGRVLRLEMPAAATSQAAQPVRTFLGTFAWREVSPVYDFEQRMSRAAADARDRVTEQLSEGFDDVSTDVGEQLWTLLDEIWRVESTDDALVARLRAALTPGELDERRRLGRALVLAQAGPFTMERWWHEPAPDEAIEASRRFVLEHAERHLDALVYALRLPTYEGQRLVTRALDAGLARGGSFDEERLFDALLDVLAQPTFANNLLDVAGCFRHLEPRPERIAKLRGVILAGGSSATRTAAEEHRFHLACAAARALAVWARNDLAADTLDGLRSAPQWVWAAATSAFLLAAQTRPDRRWVDVLNRRRPSSPVERTELDAALGACKAATRRHTGPAS